MDKKLTEKEQQEVIKNLLKQPGNQNCSDCEANNPTWVSLDFGVFLCYACSGAHRRKGPSISRVRSTNLDQWSWDWVEIFSNVGNLKANAYWESSLQQQNSKPNSNSTEETRVRFVTDKYVSKKWARYGATSPALEYQQNQKNQAQQKNQFRTYDGPKRGDSASGKPQVQANLFSFDEFKKQDPKPVLNRPQAPPSTNPIVQTNTLQRPKPMSNQFQSCPDGQQIRQSFDRQYNQPVPSKTEQLFSEFNNCQIKNVAHNMPKPQAKPVHNDLFEFSPKPQSKQFEPQPVEVKKPQNDFNLLDMDASFHQDKQQVPPSSQITQPVPLQNQQPQKQFTNYNLNMNQQNQIQHHAVQSNDMGFPNMQIGFNNIPFQNMHPQSVINSQQQQFQQNNFQQLYQQPQQFRQGLTNPQANNQNTNATNFMDLYKNTNQQSFQSNQFQMNQNKQFF